jgi:hypothetical protein
MQLPMDDKRLHAGLAGSGQLRWLNRGQKGGMKMMEQEWLECINPPPMLEYLSNHRKLCKTNGRRFTLFAIACCRRIWQLILTESCRRAVDVAERYVEGLASEEERCTAWSDGFSSVVEEGIHLNESDCQELIYWGRIYGGFAVQAALGLVGAGGVTASSVASNAAIDLALDARRKRSGQDASAMAFDATYATEQIAQAEIIREIVGNPFRPVVIDPGLLTPTVLSLAQAAYDNRNLPSGHLDNARLAALADALEDVGCDNADILNHCRQPGVHVRGCWVLDLLLGKQ